MKHTGRGIPLKHLIGNDDASRGKPVTNYSANDIGKMPEFYQKVKAGMANRHQPNKFGIVTGAYEPGNNPTVYSTG